MQDIRWQGFGVFDAQRLVSGSETNPRFQRITVRWHRTCLRERGKEVATGAPPTQGECY